LFRKFLYIIFSTLLTVNLSGQDPQFSQFYANPLYLGPSFAGAVDGSRVAAQYRNQWTDFGARFITQSISYDHYFSSFKSGIGVNVISDVAGSSQLGVVQAGIHYSYDVKVYNIWHLRPGLSFSYLQHGLFGDIVFIDDLLYPGGTGTAAPSGALENARDIDAGASLLIYTKGFWLGGTLDHLLSPDVTLHAAQAVIPQKISIYGGFDFRNKGKLLKPSDDVMTFAFLYKQQDNIRQFDIGAYWYSFPIKLGIWYRGIPTISSHRGEAVVFLAGIQTRSFNIGYSYDFTISNLLPHTLGSHEVSLTYKFLLKKKVKKGGVPCPEF
jgi:type IX secretion system PorP/SprF family membrane protein